MYREKTLSLAHLQRGCCQENVFDEKSLVTISTLTKRLLLTCQENIFDEESVSIFTLTKRFRARRVQRLLLPAADSSLPILQITEVKIASILLITKVERNSVNSENSELKLPVYQLRQERLYPRQLTGDPKLFFWPTRSFRSGQVIQRTENREIQHSDVLIHNPALFHQ